MGYQRPSYTTNISDTFRGHQNRKPPSGEPGVDYPCPYGSSIVAPEAGIVREVKTSNSGGTGRFVTIDLDDGRRTRSLHLSRVLVSAGQRVSRGQEIAKSGGSAWGKDWGVGPHVHQSLFPNWAYVWAALLDFEVYVGAGAVAVPYSQVVADRQNWLNAFRGEKLIVDGRFGDRTKDAIKRYQTYLKGRGLYAGLIDGDWGKGTQAGHQKAYDEWAAARAAANNPSSPIVTVALIARIPNKRGLQKIARLYGYKGLFDNDWGPGSQAGFQKFINHNWGGSITAWLRAKYGYVGNDQMGPQMIAALGRADTANWKAL